MFIVENKEELKIIRLALSSFCDEIQSRVEMGGLPEDLKEKFVKMSEIAENLYERIKLV